MKPIYIIATTVASALLFGAAATQIAVSQSVSSGGTGFARSQIYTRSASVALPPRSNAEASVACDDGNDVLLYGGFNGHTGGVIVYRAAPLPFFPRQTWVADALNPTPNPGTLSVDVYCARVP